MSVPIKKCVTVSFPVLEGRRGPFSRTEIGPSISSFCASGAENSIVSIFLQVACQRYIFGKSKIFSYNSARVGWFFLSTPSGQNSSRSFRE